LEAARPLPTIAYWPPTEAMVAVVVKPSVPVVALCTVSPATKPPTVPVSGGISRPAVCETGVAM
jgi:hypothetical protein